MLVPEDQVITRRQREVLQAAICLSGDLSLLEHAESKGVSYSMLQKSLSGKQTPGPRMATHLSSLLREVGLDERYKQARPSTNK